MSFKVAQPVSVHNPYEWLPSDGEDSISFRKEKTDVVAAIKFGSDSCSAMLRELRFVDCCAFYFSAMPGVAALDLSADEKPFPLGHLIQWRQSELAEAWSKHFARPYKHFVMYFLEANQVLDVVCETFRLGPEFPCEEAQPSIQPDGPASGGSAG